MMAAVLRKPPAALRYRLLQAVGAGFRGGTSSFEALQQSRGMALDHTSKWMQNKEKLSPMELIKDVPPIKVSSRVVACYGGPTKALGHPVEFINLDAPWPAYCKYCSQSFIQDHKH